MKQHYVVITMLRIIFISCLHGIQILCGAGNSSKLLLYAEGFVALMWEN